MRCRTIGAAWELGSAEWVYHVDSRPQRLGRNFVMHKEVMTSIESSGRYLVTADMQMPDWKT